MKYIITEHKLKKIIQAYLNKEFGHLKFKSRGFDKSYVVFYDESGKILFDGSVGAELMVTETTFNLMLGIFSLSEKECMDLIQDFFLNKFGFYFDEIVIDDSKHEFGDIN